MQMREKVIEHWRTFKDRQDRSIVDAPGGCDDSHNADDHYALSFSKHGRMSLHDARGEADDSLRDQYPGVWYFLGGGPSLADVDLSTLTGRQVLAVNSCCELFPQPTVWLGVDQPDDPPDRFRGVPWEDASVIKFLPRAWAGCDAGGEFTYERLNTHFFLRNHRFDAGQFLSERSVNWGADAPYGSGRSVMLAALKLLWYLGASRIVLLGVDWHMDPARPYAHSAPKDEVGCASNNDKFRILEARFRILGPILERAGMTVVNATERSRLEAFPRTTLDYELRSEAMFTERKVASLTPEETATRSAQAVASMKYSREQTARAKACPFRDCKTCNGEAACSAGKGNLAGGSRSTLDHCRECIMDLVI